MPFRRSPVGAVWSFMALVALWAQWELLPDSSSAGGLTPGRYASVPVSGLPAQRRHTLADRGLWITART